MAAEPKRVWTEAEYLDYERSQPEKHEFHGGEVLSLAGASRQHSLLGTNTSGLLYNQLRKRPCRLFSSDMRVRVGPWRSYFYPDLVVVCGEERYADDEQDTLLNPTLIIEILSPTTERYDRGEKFERYRGLESLREYVLINQERTIIERYLRQPDDQWLYTSALGLEAVMELASIGARLPLAEVYEGVMG